MNIQPRRRRVVICDDHLDDIPYDGSWDLVGLTGMTCYVNRAYEIADEFRRRGVPVVFGGPTRHSRRTRRWSTPTRSSSARPRASGKRCWPTSRPAS